MHKPVLLQEVLGVLDLKPGDRVIDATAGQGGHAAGLLMRMAPNGKLLGIDADAGQVRRARERLAAFGDRATLVQGSYAEISQLARDFKPVRAILLDLGFSSWQTDASGRGFSFQRSEPLDMRYDTRGPLTAERVVNRYAEGELERIFSAYGEEQFARRISRAVSRARETARISNTEALKAIIMQAVPGGPRAKMDSVRRVFQALRIAVNGELENLKAFLPQALGLLLSGGRLAVISFHSLEDRMVKQFFKESERQGVATIITKKPVIASPEEVSDNPRARSAKMRAIIKRG